MRSTQKPPGRHSDSYNLFFNIIAKDAKITARVASDGDCKVYDSVSLSEKIGKDDGGHGFYYNGGAEGEADVVAAGDAGFGDAGCGFERHAEHKRVAVGDAAVYAASVVGKGRLDAFVVAAAVVLRFFAALRMTTRGVLRMTTRGVLRMTGTGVFLSLSMTAVMLFVVMVAMVLREGVVVLRAAHGGGFEAVTEFDAADAGDGEDGVRDFGLYAIPEGLSHPDGKALCYTFNYSTKGVSIQLCGGQKGIPGVRICVAAHLDKTGLNIGKMNHLFGDDAGSNYSQCEPAAEVAAATGIVVSAIL